MFKKYVAMMLYIFDAMPSVSIVTATDAFR